MVSDPFTSTTNLHFCCFPDLVPVHHEQVYTDIVVGNDWFLAQD